MNVFFNRRTARRVLRQFCKKHDYLLQTTSSHRCSCCSLGRQRLSHETCQDLVPPHRKQCQVIPPKDFLCNGFVWRLASGHRPKPPHAERRLWTQDGSNFGTEPKAPSQGRVCQTCVPPHRDPNRSGVREHREAGDTSKNCVKHAAATKPSESLRSAGKFSTLTAKNSMNELPSLSSDRHEEDCGHALYSAEHFHSPRRTSRTWLLADAASFRRRCRRWCLRDVLGDVEKVRRRVSLSNRHQQWPQRDRVQTALQQKPCLQ